jgi:argininosuccinate lyase
MSFAPEYVTHVLNENFEDAKALFFAPLIAINYAHLVMLASTGIVSAEDAHVVRMALDSVAHTDLGGVRYDGTYEDLFFYVERLIVDGCGEDAAGRLHTARSRNDIDMTMYRMRQREFILGLAAATFDLRQALTTVAHYLLAVIEQLERDGSRLRAAYDRTNQSPLGACAITGTGFPIDRGLTSELLGFCAPTGNTYGSIASVDYLLESASAAAVLLVGLGRFAQDLLLWCTEEFGYLRLGDGFVQASSIMPQKRNPVAIEHVRAIASHALGQAQAIVTSVHNTPFGDIVDTEDDAQPLVFSMFRDAGRAVKLMAAAMATAQFDAARLEERAGEGWTTLTELADTMTRDHRIPFRVAHDIAGRLVAARGRSPERPLSLLVEEISRELTGAPLMYTDEQLARILDPRHFVNVRRTPGGPAPGETSRAAGASRALLHTDRDWWKGATEALAAAEHGLAGRSARL